MKKLLIIIASGVITSCDTKDYRKRINCDYHGGVILHKYGFKKSGLGDESYAVQYNGEVIRYVDVYDIDSGYEVGDTINKPCLTN